MSDLPERIWVTEKDVEKKGLSVKPVSTIDDLCAAAGIETRVVVK